MAVTAQSGVFSWGMQSAKAAAATTFYQHRAADIDLGAISDDRLGPPEVGGIPVPTFPYRAGVMVAGGATINPRLESTFGWLLYGAAGYSTVATNEDVLDNTVTGMYHHEFYFDTIAGYVPWMTFRKHIPGTSALYSLGETYIDSKIVNMTLALPNDGPISARVDVLGRTPGFDDNPSWTYSNTEFEDYESIPVACVTGGYLQVPTFSATALPITQCNVTLANQPLDVRQEKVYGSPYLEDVTIIGRQLTVDMILKWTDPALYLSILTGSTTGTTWSPAPWMSDLDVLSLSTRNAILTTPWQLRVEAPQVMYQVAGPIRLAGNGAVMMRVQGTAIAPASGNYYTLHLSNLRSTAYASPAGDTNPPTLSGAEIGDVNASTIVLTFTEAITVPGSWTPGFSVDVNAAPVTVLDGWRVAASQMALLIDDTVIATDTVTVSYDTAVGNLQDLSGNQVLSFTDQAVTNNVT